MRKILPFLIIFVLILCAGCAADTEAATPDVSVPEAGSPELITHSCENPCEECSLCKNVSCSEAPCLNKCTCCKEEPYVFSTGDYISDSPISVETDTFVFDIGENIYVPGNLEELANTLESTMEKLSGLDFDGAGYARDFYPDGKIHMDVSRDSLYSWDGILDTSEVGAAYASTQSVTLSPGDLFLGNSKAIAHELGHVLMFRQSGWSHCQLLNEGFAEYTTYLTMLEFDKLDGKVGFTLDRPIQSIADMAIFDYEKLYEQPLEYWFENTFEYSGNANYVIGFRFMAYLHETFGEYSKWITEFENTYSFKSHSGPSNESAAAQQIEVLKAVYGEDVLDNFYPWLKENFDRFDEALEWTQYRDLKSSNGINLYPRFNALESLAVITRFEYENLYINIDCLRSYISDYKGFEDTGLILVTSEPVTVNLYHADGSFTTVMSNSEVQLDDVSYIKLVGQGTLDQLEISGQFTKHLQVG